MEPIANAGAGLLGATGFLELAGAAAPAGDGFVVCWAMEGLGALALT